MANGVPASMKQLTTPYLWNHYYETHIAKKLPENGISLPVWLIYKVYQFCIRTFFNTAWFYCKERWKPEYKQERVTINDFKRTFEVYEKAKDKTTALKAFAKSWETRSVTILMLPLNIRKSVTLDGLHQEILTLAKGVNPAVQQNNFSKQAVADRLKAKGITITVSGTSDTQNTNPTSSSAQSSSSAAPSTSSSSSSSSSASSSSSSSTATFPSQTTPSSSSNEEQIAFDAGDFKMPTAELQRWMKTFMQMRGVNPDTPEGQKAIADATLLALNVQNDLDSSCATQ